MFNYLGAAGSERTLFDFDHQKHLSCNGERDPIDVSKNLGEEPIRHYKASKPIDIPNKNSFEERLKRMFLTYRNEQSSMQMSFNELLDETGNSCSLARIHMAINALPTRRTEKDDMLVLKIRGWLRNH